MEASLNRLIEVYRQEQQLYGRILDHVRRQRELIEAGSGYTEINQELTRKRDLLQQVEVLEAGIREESERWRRRRPGLDGDKAKQLMAQLAAVTGLVEEILDRERENEILLTSRRQRSTRPVGNRRGAAASYERQRQWELEG